MNKAEVLHSSLLLCGFGHADSWKMVQYFKLSLEWLVWSQGPFQTRCLNSELELLSSNSFKVETIDLFKGPKCYYQPKLSNRICKTQGFVQRVIIKRYCGWRWRMRGQIRLLLWLFRSTQTPPKLTHSPMPHHDLLLSHDHFVLYTHSNSAGSPNQPCCSFFWKHLFEVC